MRPLVAALVLGSLSLTAAPARAGGTPIPPWREDRVAVAGTADTFDPLRRFLAGFESGAGVEFHVVVVARSDPQGRAGVEHAASAVDYVDATWEAWRGAGLDPARHVIVCLALENRGVALHAGSRWVGMGFERGAITQVIDRSPFAQAARAGDYAGAVERLIQAVDMHLVALERGRRAGKERAQGRLGVARERLAKARARLAALPYEHAFAEGRVRLADEHLRRAAAAQAQDDPETALDGAEDAVRLLDEADREVDARETLRAAAPGALRQAKERLAAADAALRASPVLTAGLAERLDAARGQLDQAEQRLAHGDPQGVDAMIGRAAGEVAAVEAALARAVAQHRFRTRTLPTAMGTLAALAAAAVVVGLRLYRGRRAQLAHDEVRRWEESLAQAAPRLLALEDEHPVVFGTEAPLERFTGETAKAFREAASQADDLFIAFALSRDVLDRAKKLAATAGALTWGAFDRARAALTTDEVEVGSEELAVERLFLPERRVVKARAGTLLRGLERDYEQTRARLGELERVVVEVPERLRAASRALGAAEERQVELEDRGPALPVHGDERARLEAEHARLSALAPSDPVGILEAVATVEAATAALTGRLAKVAAALDALEGALARLDDDEGRVAALRADEGLRVEEPGFEPEALAQVARDHAREGRRAMGDGRDDDAIAEAGAAGEAQAELRRLLEATLASREETPRCLDAEDQRRHALSGRLPERRARLQALRAQHDDDALQPALDNADEAQVALSQVGAALGEARAGLLPDAQRYLAAAELVRRGAVVLDQIEALYAEVEARAHELDRAAAHARQALATAIGHARQVDALLRGGDRFVSAPLRAAIDQGRLRLDEEQRAQAAPRPHWPRLRDQALAVEAFAREVLVRATAEHAAWLEVEALLPTVRARVDQQAQTLAAATTDRQPANAQLAEARSALADAARGAGAGRADWVAVLALLRKAEGCVASSCRLAQEDASKARAAREAIAQAHRQQGTADRSYGHGVRVDLGASERALAGARSALTGHDYERALDEALRAQREADEAGRKAEAEARHRAWLEAQERERRERERRERERREAASRRTSSASSFSYSSSRTSSSSRSSSSSSGGSSFGRSSSGGSSW